MRKLNGNVEAEREMRKFDYDISASPQLNHNTQNLPYQKKKTTRNNNKPKGEEEEEEEVKYTQNIY